MKTILVATDYSDAANNAVEYASELAKKSNSKIILLNVLKLSPHVSNSLASSADIEKLISQGEKRLAAFSQSIHEKHGIEVEHALMQEDTIESLRQYVSVHDIDLVVMGIDSNLLEYKWLGNTTTAAIDLQKFPLLVVPNDIHFQSIK